MITVALIAAFASLATTLLNGVFLLMSKRTFDRNLAVLNAPLGVIRDLAVKQNDRRADVYRDAVEPFSKLFTATGSGDESSEVVASFRQAALEAGALGKLFGSTHARQRFNDIYNWTDTTLPTPRAKRPAQTLGA